MGQGNSTDQASPVQIPGTTWKKVYAGNTHPRAIKTDGTLWAWGTDAYGTAGHNGNNQRDSPVQIPGTYDFFWHGGNAVSMAAINN